MERNEKDYPFGQEMTFDTNGTEEIENVKKVPPLKNGGLAFILGAVLPQVIASIVLIVGTVLIGLKESGKGFLESLTLIATNPEQFSQLMMRPSLQYLSLVVIQVVVFLCCLTACKGSFKTLFKVARLEKVKDKKDMFIIPLLCVGVILFLSQSGNLFILLLEKIGYNPTPLPFPTASGVGGVILSLVVIGLLPAICEELLFRGLIFRSLQRIGTSKAILISALLFSIIHGNPQQTVYQFLMGVTLAYVTYKTGSLLPAMFLHFLNNGVAIFLDAFKVESYGAFAIPLSVLGIAAFAVSIIYFHNKKQKETCVLDPSFYFDKNPAAIALKERADGSVSTILYVMGGGVCILLWLLSFVSGLA